MLPRPMSPCRVTYCNIIQHLHTNLTKSKKGIAEAWPLLAENFNIDSVNVGDPLRYTHFTLYGICWIAQKSL